MPGANGSGQDHGALVASLAQDGPASHADIQAGDVIIDVNGMAIATPRELSISVAELTPGSNASIKLVRNGEVKVQQVSIGTLPGSGGSNGQSEDQGQGFGLALGPISPEMRQQLDLPAGTHGAAVRSVTSGSPAEQAGLQAGDIVVAVGDKAVTNPGEAANALRAASKAGQPVALRIIHDGQLAFVAISPNTGSAEGGSSDDNDDGG